MTPVTEAFCANRASLGRFAWSIVRNANDAEDVLQEACCRALRVELNRPIEQPRPFLFRIVKHLALTHRERSARWESVEIDDELFANNSKPEDELHAIESVDQRLEELGRLTPGCRRVYELRQFQELSHKEIATQLGIAVSTVEKHLIRANREIQLGRKAVA